MTDRPILFNAAMVRALREGRKTQTRRVLNIPDQYNNAVVGRRGLNKTKFIILTSVDDYQENQIASRTYATGDYLWVRENWRVGVAFDDTPPRDLYPAIRDHLYFEADTPKGMKVDFPLGRFRQSIFMPRWASRFTLEVTEIRIQRVQDISNDDAIAEGISDERNTIIDAHGAGGIHQEITANGFTVNPIVDDQIPEIWKDASFAYAELWDSINTKRGLGWDANPWVAAYTFEVTNQNIDDVGRSL